MEDSDAKEALELTKTLKVLRDEILVAMEHGQWFSEHALHHQNVKSLIDELLLVLQHMAKDTAAALSTKISLWLSREFMARAAFEHLHHFRLLFSTLHEIGSQKVPAGSLVDALAAVDKDSDELPDSSVGDVVARTTFRKGPLYISFVDHRTRQVIQKAKNWGHLCLQVYR